jgi:phosphoribosylanthranilate isomerase
MKIKICGITSIQDAQAAAEAGADAVGLNFVAGPRQIDLERAEQILKHLPPLLTPVALIDVSGGRIPDSFLELLGCFWVSHIQMYGQVSPDAVLRLRSEGFRPVLVQHVQAGEFPGATQGFLDRCAAAGPAAILLDAYDDTRLGGTGQAVDWDRIAEARRSGGLDGWPPILLAGGLTPDNVAAAVSVVRPWGVDVSSGVEDSPGHKSAAKMRAFVQSARRSGGMGSAS